MIRRPPRSTLSSSSAASDVYKRQTRRRREGNREALLASRESKAQSDVRLARAGVAERDDVVAAQDVFTAGEFENQHLVEAGDRYEVERIEALHRWKARLANAPFDDTPLLVDEFQFDQSQQIGRVINPLARGLPGHLVVLAQNRRKPELLQMM